MPGMAHANVIFNNSSVPEMVHVARGSVSVRLGDGSSSSATVWFASLVSPSRKRVVTLRLKL